MQRRNTWPGRAGDRLSVRPGCCPAARGRVPWAVQHDKGNSRGQCSAPQGCLRYGIHLGMSGQEGAPCPEVREQRCAVEGAPGPCSGREKPWLGSGCWPWGSGHAVGSEGGTQLLGQTYVLHPSVRHLQAFRAGLASPHTPQQGAWSEPGPSPSLCALEPPLSIPPHTLDFPTWQQPRGGPDR